MNIASWLRKHSVRSASARHGQPGFRAHNRPCVESLEQRCLLSTLTVLNNADTGAGSLRATLAAADNGDTITFASSLRGKTITLTSGQLTVTKSIDIEGLGRDELTISGDNASRVFAVASGSTVAIDQLKIANGLADQGAGIDNFGTLTVSQCTLSDNTAVGGSGDSTTPDAANGGGIANEVGASLTLTQSLLTGNVAAASPGNDSFGGALLNLGGATVANCTFTGNQATGGGSSSFFDGSIGRSHRKLRIPAKPAIQLHTQRVQLHVHG